ncbi:MAG: RNA polymerase sigma factor [Candidatus Latescibacteria bacterium]|nr:RNA polymerase sigma factor [Candidatus Latescibacterota bacterium]
MTEADGILVRQVLSGNKGAFEPLVERHKGTVYALVVGKTGDFASAEDIVQGTFVEAYRNLKSLKDPARFRAWVRGIAMNLSNEWFRKRKRNVPIDDLYSSKEAALQGEVLPESFVRLPTAPDSDYEVEEMRNYVLRAVERLPERYREVVLLHYMDGLKYREIAEMLEVPESTVLGRLQVGRDQLREELLPIVEETLKEQQPTSELTRKVMAALPPMLLLTPDSIWASVKRFFGRSPYWRTGGILTAAVVGTGIYYSGFVALVQWENGAQTDSQPGVSAAPMAIEIEKEDVSNPVNRAKQAEGLLQQSATKGNANGQAGSAGSTIVTQQRKASTDNPVRPTMTLSHSPADSVVTINYTIPDSASKDSVHVGLKVYNLSGMLAALLVDDIQSVGSHTFLLEKRPLSDGAYFVSLTLNRSRAHAVQKRLSLFWADRR